LPIKLHYLISEQH